MWRQKDTQGLFFNAYVPIKLSRKGSSIVNSRRGPYCVRVSQGLTKKVKLSNPL